MSTAADKINKGLGTMPGSVTWQTSKGDVDLGAHAFYCSCAPSEIPLAQKSLLETEFLASST